MRIACRSSEGVRLPKLWPDLEGVGPIRDIIGIHRAPGRVPAGVVEARSPETHGDTTGWARGLRESAVGLVREPRRTPSR